MTELSNEQINRALRLAIGKCWHEDIKQINYADRSIAGYACPKCDDERQRRDLFINPTYSASLDAVAEVEKFVIEKVGAVRYSNFIADQRIPHPTNRYEFAECILLATALVRAKACHAALGLEDADAS